MTHDHKDGCCGGHNATEGKQCKTGCCGSARNLVTAASIVLAIAGLGYGFVQHSNAQKGAVLIEKPKADAEALVVGEDTVIAEIDGKDVRKSDVAQTIKELGANVPPAAVDQILPAFTEQYINLQLINKAATKTDVLKDPQVRTQLANSQEQILRAAYLNSLFEGQITEDTLKAAYKAKYEDAPLPTEVHARHILVDSKDKADALLTQIKGGANFEKLASENSKDPSAARGGDLGYFTKAEMVPEFGTAAFDMSKGEVSSAPVKTQFGWHILQVLDKRTRVKPSYEEAKPALEQEARQVILDAKLKELREEADVKIMTPPAPPAVEATPVDAAPAAAPAAESAPVPEAITPAETPAPAAAEETPAAAPAAE